MALGVRDKNPNPGNTAPLGVNQNPNGTPATIGGGPPPAPSVPQYSNPNGGKAVQWGGGNPNGSKPTAGPPLPPSTGPIFPQDPVQPISFNGQHFNPTTAPFGADVSTPGVREQFWNNNQNLWFQDPQLDWVDTQIGQFQDPWQSETFNQDLLGTIGNKGAGQQYWNGIGGQFNTLGSNVIGGYKGGNNAKTAFDMTRGSIPGSLQPQFDAYYDRMADKAMSNVNSQSAARGVYGSNSALNNSIGAGLDIEAQRAKAATDFSLEDSANQRSWLDSLSNQGRSADLTGLGIFDANKAGAQFGLDKFKTGGDLAFKAEEMEFNKNKTLSDIAFGIDDQRLQRVGAGIETAFESSDRHKQALNDAFDAAGKTQDAFEGRTGQLFDDLGGFENDVMSFMSDNYDALFSGDEANFQQQMETMLAQTADQRGWNQQQQERIMRDMAKVYEMIKGQQAEGAAGG